MKLTKTQASRIVASFGVGLAGAAMTSDAEAAIISLTPVPGTNPFCGAASCGTNVNLGPGTFYQFNDTIGKSILAGAGLAGFRSAPASQTITAGQGFGNLVIGPGATGTGTFGFLTSAGQVGWLRMNFGGSGGAITYLAAAYNDTPGGAIHSGSLQAVPEPTSLALAALASLALGSRRVRRLREKRQAS